MMKKWMAILLASVMGLTFTTCVSAEAEMAEENKTDVIENLDLNQETKKSNRESGFGRYDVVMEPKDVKDPAVIMEFKVLDKEDEESSLEDTAQNALRQIEEKQYAADLPQRGIPENRILKYGFAFEGEKCLIRKAAIN